MNKIYENPDRFFGPRAQPGSSQPDRFRPSTVFRHILSDTASQSRSALKIKVNYLNFDILVLAEAARLEKSEQVTSLIVAT